MKKKILKILKEKKTENQTTLEPMFQLKWVDKK
jgi:hypothetical protein